TSSQTRLVARLGVPRRSKRAAGPPTFQPPGGPATDCWPPAAAPALSASSEGAGHGGPRSRPQRRAPVLSAALPSSGQAPGLLPPLDRRPVGAGLPPPGGNVVALAHNLHQLAPREAHGHPVVRPPSRW